MAPATKAAHVLVVPLPIHGHVNPMLQLSGHLSSLGCSVTFVTTASTNQTAASTMESISADPTRIRLHPLNDSNRSERFEFAESLKFMVSKGEELEQLTFEYQQVYGRVTMVILDTLLLEPFSKLSFVQSRHVVAFWTSSAAMLHVVVNAGTLVERGYLPPSAQNGTKTVDSSVLPGIPCELCVYQDLPDDPLDSTYKVMRGLRAWMVSAPSVLLNTFEELEKDVLSALQLQGFNNLIPVGPLLCHQAKSNMMPTTGSAHVFSWLDKQPISQVLYVSFGTMLDLQLEQFEELVHGLVSSQQPFLWVVSTKAQQKTEVGKLVDELRSRTGERGKIVAWSPQFQVLQHSSVGGFLTHCGWNSTLESITAGVPMVAWPLLGDQLINSKYVVDVWKVGVRIQARSPDGSVKLVSRKEIEASIREVMNGTAMHEKAKQLSEKAGEAMKSIQETKLRKVLNLS